MPNPEHSEEPQEKSPSALTPKELEWKLTLLQSYHLEDALRRLEEWADRSLQSMDSVELRHFLFGFESYAKDVVKLWKFIDSEPDTKKRATFAKRVERSIKMPIPQRERTIAIFQRLLVKFDSGLFNAVHDDLSTSLGLGGTAETARRTAEDVMRIAGDVMQVLREEGMLGEQGAHLERTKSLERQMERLRIRLAMEPVENAELAVALERGRKSLSEAEKNMGYARRWLQLPTDASPYMAFTGLMFLLATKEALLASDIKPSASERVNIVVDDYFQGKMRDMRLETMELEIAVLVKMAGALDPEALEKAVAEPGKHKDDAFPPDILKLLVGGAETASNRNLGLLLARGVNTADLFEKLAHIKRFLGRRPEGKIA